MGKDYLADLQKWVEQKKGLNGNSRNSARVVFLAIREDVRDAIDAGYSLTMIWEHLHETGRVSTTYETFRRHVKKYIYQRTAAATVVQKLPPQAAVKNENDESGRLQKARTDTAEKRTVKADPEPNTGSTLPSFNFKPPKKRNN